MNENQQHKPVSDREAQGISGDWICVGALRGTHGVRGDVKLASFMSRTDDIFTCVDLRRGADGPVISVTKVRRDKDGFIAQIKGITTREDAMALKGARLYVHRDTFVGDADGDDYFVADLIGLPVYDTKDTIIGHVRTLENFGAEDLLEVVLDQPIKTVGRYAFIPFRKSLVPVVDIKAGRIVVDIDLWVQTQVSERDE